MLLRKFNINDLTEQMYRDTLLLLPKEKRDKIQSLHFIEDRKRSAAGYMLAFECVEQVCSLPKEKIKIAFDENSKPYIAGIDIHISIAHSGQYAICAVSEREIGVDIEKIRKVNLRCTRRFCTEEEKVYIFGKEPTDDDYFTDDMAVTVRLLEIWTKKEALGKMTGQGYMYDMTHTDVSFVKTERYEDYIISICEKE